MRCAFLFALFLSLTSAARATILYDGSTDSSPSSRGILFYASATHTTNNSGGGLTTFDSTADNTDQAGWLPLGAMPTMNRAGNGYVVSLEMKVLKQNTANNDRAGISLIALSSDHIGVEIAFFENEVWAYEIVDPPNFVHAEGHAFTTTAAMTTYDLAIHGSTYELFAGGNSILTGNLRDYSPRGAVYGANNFIWLGDDTQESGGSFQFSRIAINNVTPEPTATLAGIPGLLALCRRKR